MERTRRLLIVDDEPSLRRLLRLALRGNEWIVDEADCAETALLRVAQEHYDVLLIDNNLPTLSGIELIRRVRARDEAIPIVTMTGHRTRESATELLHLGVTALLEKPFDDVFDVVSTLDVAVAGKRRHAEQRSRRERGRDGLKIILVCPNAAERRWLVGRFARNHDAVLEADAGDGIVRIIKSARPDLVLVDAQAVGDIADWLAEAAIAAPAAAFAVIAERPSLALVVQLIGLGVRALLERPLYGGLAAARLEAVLARLRANRWARQDPARA